MWRIKDRHSRQPVPFSQPFFQEGLSNRLQPSSHWQTVSAHLTGHQVTAPRLGICGLRLPNSANLAVCQIVDPLRRDVLTS